jgi:ribonuclease III
MSAISKETIENEIFEIIDGKKIYPVANENNFLISKSEVQDILLKGGIKDEIKNLQLFQKAFVHESYKSGSDFEKEMKFYGNINGLSFEINPKILKLQPESSEKFEFVGDGHIQSVVGRYLWLRFPNEDQGFYSKKRSKLVKTEGLSKLASSLNFDKYLIISKHVEIVSSGRKNAKYLEDAFEAFIASIFEEFVKEQSVGVAYQKVHDFIVSLLHTYIDWTEIIFEDDNFKDQLMRYFQKEFGGRYPKYEQLSVENNVSSAGISNRKFHTCVKDINGNIIGEGVAKAKRESEQKAAENALKHYGMI